MIDTWLEIDMAVLPDFAQAVIDIAFAQGSMGTNLIERTEINAEEAYGYGNLFPEEGFNQGMDKAIVKAYFDIVENPDALSEQLGQAISQVTSDYSISYQEVSADAWENKWQENFKAQSLTRYVTIAPSWEEYIPRDESEKVISMDPGMAFGTGRHETTFLSLELLEKVMRPGMDVYDVGTGSGILAIAAKAFGANKVQAFDLDPRAVEITRHNMTFNDYASDIEVFENDLLKGVKEPVEIIVANILPDILALFTEQAYHLVKPGGRLILSGILEEKCDKMIKMYEEAGFTWLQTNQSRDWTALLFEKKEDEL